MERLSLAVLAFFFYANAMAEITIIDVRRNIPLSDEEPTYTDFYLSAGEGEGLKKNLVVTVFRQINVRDNNGAQSFGEIQVPVAQLRILAVYGKISIAREFKDLSRDENPMLEQTGIMSGDKVTLTGSFIDNSKVKRKPQAVVAKPSPPTGDKVTVFSAGPTVTTTAPAAPATTPAVTPAEKPQVAAGAGVPEALLEKSPTATTIQ